MNVDELPQGMLHKPVFGRLEPIGKDGLYQVVESAGEWTTTPPTVPGWYWVYCYRRVGLSHPFLIVRLKLESRKEYAPNGYVLYPTGRASITDWSKMGATHWLGPLTVPELPT